jgi:pimeloyl-ACP methyl ester carboxylesterase
MRREQGCWLGWACLPGYSRGIGQIVNKGAVTTMAAETPTIVFVHGAWADATGFDAEIRALQARGFRAIGFANPLRDLAGDATYLAEFLRSLTGPIVLVGHSYGGNVISTAATGNDQVQALVYFNGWMCDEGESQRSSLSGSKAASWGPRSGPCRTPPRAGARAPTSSWTLRRSVKPSPPTSTPPRPR